MSSNNPYGGPPQGPYGQGGGPGPGGPPQGPYGQDPGPYGPGTPSQPGPPPGQPGQPPYGYPQQPPPVRRPGGPAYGFGPYAEPGGQQPPGYGPGGPGGPGPYGPGQPVQPVPAPPPQKKGKGKGLIIGGVIALALILIGVVAAVLIRDEPAVTTVPSPNTSTTGSVPSRQQRAADQRAAGGEGLGRGELAT